MKLTLESLAPLMSFEPHSGWLEIRQYCHRSWNVWTVDDLKRIAIFRVEIFGDPPSAAYNAVMQEMNEQKERKKAAKRARRDGREA